MSVLQTHLARNGFKGGCRVVILVHGVARCELAQGRLSIGVHLHHCCQLSFWTTSDDGVEVCLHVFGSSTF